MFTLFYVITLAVITQSLLHGKTALPRIRFDHLIIVSSLKLKFVCINCFKYKSLRYSDYLVCIQSNSFILNLNHLPTEVRIRYIFSPVRHSNIALFQWIPLSLRHRGAGNYTISHDVLTLWFLCNKRLFLYIMELDMSSFGSSVIDL